jgi:hypothetical protein
MTFLPDLKTDPFDLQISELEMVLDRQRHPG